MGYKKASLRGMKNPISITDKEIQAEAKYFARNWCEGRGRGWMANAFETGAKWMKDQYEVSLYNQEHIPQESQLTLIFPE